MENLENILKAVIKLSGEVGDFIRAQSESFKRSHVEHKGFNDLVSFVDKEAEKKLVGGLGNILPEAGFLVEEGTSDKKGGNFRWIVDPLDGTTNFVHGLPVYAISIALMKNDQVVLGLIYEVNREECFYAIKEQRACLNGKEISVSPFSNLGDCLIATGFPYQTFDKAENFLKILNGFMQQTHGVRRLGSAAVDLAYVACGRFEGFYESDLKPWDVAAGAFIVQQAGGIVTDYKGGDDFIFGKEIIAGNEAHPRMLKVIQENW